MSRRMGKAWLLMVLFLVIYPDQTVQAQDGKQAQTAEVKRVLVVSLQDRRLALVENGEVKKVYVVAIGTASTPSPVGTFTIVTRVSNPTYYHDGEVLAPGPGNPVGTRWMGLSVKGYGIHGTNAPRSIGRATSHGCIRMGRRDLEELFAQVRTGDQVEIIGERNAETVALFGGAEPVASSATEVAVKAAPEPAPSAGATSAVAALAAAMPIGR
ncbi:L,D-transpeptidase [Paracidobacterium acidisoli]|uniref:L,D-transpeptidase n=1 Tax=Paracidobacterium acidisoli TaxID=2303751 RepID=A0A372IMZ2_9BACT|nr:L,D-transpeptidase [Paracidobacterium acidisoli]MBT9331896.1 L,D-transpeptidase [Paracidobacterium acidisoli]